MLAGTAAVTLARSVRADARGAAAALRARAAAEGALALTLAAWPQAWTVALAPGTSDARAVASPAGTATVRTFRLDARRYLLVAEARATALAGTLGPAVRRAGAYARLDYVAYEPSAALTAAGPVTLAADAEVRGADDAPPGWADCAGGTPASTSGQAAVAAPAVVAAPGARVTGPVLTAPAAWAPPSPERFGDVSRAALTARADVVLPAGGVLTPVPRAAAAPADGCVRDATSWGDPWRGGAAVPACAADAPVVHVRGPGTTVLRGPARFQGTLLVDGSLTVEGPVDVAGVLVVNGSLRTTGALVVDGAVVVRGADVSLAAGTRVRRSGCALERAAALAARPVLLPRRAWAEVVR